MSTFKDFDYKNILVEKYPLMHDLDFTKISGDTWFTDTLKKRLNYSIPADCRCGAHTKIANPDIKLTQEEYLKVIVDLLNAIPHLFAFLFSSIEWHDIIVKHIIFPERFLCNMADHISDCGTLWGATFETNPKKDFNMMYAMGGSRECYPTITRINWGQI